MSGMTKFVHHTVGQQGEPIPNLIKSPHTQRDFEALAQQSNFCWEKWRWLLHTKQQPACGTTRTHLFHHHMLLASPVFASGHVMETTIPSEVMSAWAQCAVWIFSHFLHACQLPACQLQQPRAVQKRAGRESQSLFKSCFLLFNCTRSRGWGFHHFPSHKS